MLRDTTSRGLYVRFWPPHTSERRGGGGGCEQEGWQGGLLFITAAGGTSICCLYVVYYHRPFCFTARLPFEFARLPRSFSTLGSEPEDARSALACLSSGGADLDFKAGTQP